MNRLLFLLGLGGWVGSGLAAFPEPFNSEQDREGAPMAAAAAAASMEVPEGFEVQVFACEPEVQNPIAMTWDHRGRMWVAENYTYAERAVRFERGLRDRVLILEDADGDGRAEKRTVFTEDVQVLTSVEVGRGGVWLMCPPQLVFLPDADGDDVPDGPAEVKLDGLTVAESSYHNFANGLRWGPDGWLYGRCGHSCPARVGAPGTAVGERVPMKGGIWRYHPERAVFEVMSHGTTNPWGFDWDENGDLFFINTVNGHLWQMMLGAHLKESFGASPHPFVYERLDTIADHYHYDTSGSWSESRDGAANAFGGGHAHIGMMIYQAGQWPERYRNQVFTLNLHGRRANVERLERVGSGFVGRHEPDVFLAKDPWFRGMEISQGPDGAAYVLDWSDTGECHDHTGVHRTSGRIYKIRHGAGEPPEFADLETLTPAGLGRMLEHSNAWFARQALVRLAVVDGGEVLAEDLRKRVASGASRQHRLRALWALAVRGGVTGDWLLDFAADEDERVRVWAVRLLTDRWGMDTIEGDHRAGEGDPEVLRALVKRAQREPSAKVRLELTSVLQRLPVAEREGLGTALASWEADAEDAALPSMLWWGVSPLAMEDPMALVRMAEVCEWPDTLRWMARALAERIEVQPGAVNALLELAAEAREAKRGWLLAGVSEGLKGRRKAPKPAAWEAVVAVAGGDGLVRELSVVFGDGRALEEVTRVALDQGADLGVRRAALRALIEARPEDLRQVCESLLDERELNVEAVRGLALFDDAALGQALAKRYRRFPEGSRAGVVAVLVSRPAWASALLDEMEAGRVAKSAMTPFDARQVLTLGDGALEARLKAVWGEVRESPAVKREQIEALKREMPPAVLAAASLGQGRLLFQAACSACHQLYGDGGQVGPDLTGSGRSSLEYLLENIVDPSAVVGADYQVTVVTLKDGRVLSGVVAAENEGALTLRLLTEETPLRKEEIHRREVLPASMMPEGLLQMLTPEQRRDLIAYLMHPSQVPLPRGE